MPKPIAGWTLHPFQAVPKPSVSHKPEAPTTSWWIGKSRSEFTAQLVAEVGRMNSSRMATYVNAATRFAE